MAAVSYSITQGQTLEQVTSGTAAPSGGAGTIELRIDQTATAITDGSYPGSTRPLLKVEALILLRILEEYLHQDSNVFPGTNPPT